MKLITGKMFFRFKKVRLVAKTPNNRNFINSASKLTHIFEEKLLAAVANLKKLASGIGANNLGHMLLQFLPFHISLLF